MESHTARYRLRVLGPLTVDDAETDSPADIPAGKPLALLAYVALAKDPCERDAVARLLWPGVPDRRSRASIRQALWFLRRALDPDVVVSEGDLLEIPEGMLRTDVDELEAHLAAGDLERAHALWSGGPFASFTVPDAPDFNRWADGVRARLERRLGEALLDRSTGLAGSGDLEAALTWFRRTREVRPYLEEPLTEEARCLVQLRRFDEAEAVLAEARRVIDAPTPGVLEDLEDLVRSGRRERVEAHDDLPPTGFVGRSREFAELMGLWRSASRRRPRLAALLGTAGVGKSRLGAEWLRAARTDGAATATVACVPGEEAIEWGAVSELVGELMRLPGAAGISATSEAVLRALRPSLANGPDPLPGIELRPAPLADAVRDLVAAVAHEAPLAILLDDVQWADTDSTALLLRLTRALGAGSPVMLLATVRTNGHHDAVALRLESLERAGLARTIRLEPLTEPEVAELLVLLAEPPPGRDPGDLAARLHAASGGNPLLLVELLKALWQDGLLVRRDDGEWAFADTVFTRTDAVPATLSRSVGGRLDDLPPEVRRVAAALAASPRAAAPERIATELSMPPETVEDALRSLSTRGLVRRDERGRVGFEHELVRHAVREALGDAAGHGAGRQRTLPKVAAIAALLVLAVAGTFMAREGEAPYGGGSLYLFAWPDVHQVRIGGGGTVEPLNRWTLQENARLQQVRTTTAGDVRWFGYSVDPVEAPDALEFLGPDSAVTIFADEGDDGLTDLSPDGRYGLVLSQNMAAPHYQLDLLRVDLESGESKRLLRLPYGQSASPRWSRDGAMIALGLDEAWDTLIVMNPDGERLLSLPGPTPQVTSLEWCGRDGELVFLGIPPGAPASPWTLDVATGDMQEIETAHPLGGTLACSPDGSAVLYHGLVRGERALVIEDRRTGDARVLSLDPALASHRVLWLEDRPAPVPVALDLVADRERLRWGERRPLDVRVPMSDGSTGRVDPVRWTSRDEGVASVTDGVVAGNTPGRTWIVADVHGWLRDSVEVSVSGDPVERPLLADRFEDLDPETWILVGEPEPVATEVDGEPVLELRGDGRWSDGILLRRPLSLARGASVEFEFRLPVNRDQYQWFYVCLRGGVAPDPDADRLAVIAGADEHLCLVYPWRELAGTDPTSYHFYSHLQPVGPARAPTVLPADDWTHVAIQVRADGQPTLVLGREHVVHLEHPIRNDPGMEWRLEMMGAAVGTELYLRNLIVWAGARW